jgi:hypothetical protein
MTHDRHPAAIIDLTEVRMTQKLAEAQSRLAPETTEAMNAEELSRHVAAQLATLPSGERTLLRRNLAVTVHDLEGLVTALQDELAGLAQELRTVSIHSDAVSAYGQVGRRPSDNRS